MSEDTTRNFSVSFEERVLSELAAIRQEVTQQNARLSSLETRMISMEKRMDSMEKRMDSMEARLTSLEEKVDARLRETRPIWESVQAQLKGIDNRLDILSRQFKTFLQDLSELRARVERLEDNQPTG